MESSNNLKAIAIMCLGMLFIPLGDTAGKLLTDNAGVAPAFVAWSRFALGAVMIYLAFWGRGFDFTVLGDWRVWLRAGFITGGISCILTALKTEPIANVFAAFFVGPILSYFVSAVLLKEQISRLRTVLLFAGFCGVLLVVKPGLYLSTGMAFALAAGMFYGAFLVASKWLSMLTKPRMLLLSHLLIGALVLTPWGIRAIPELSVEIGGLVLLSAFSSAFGNLMLIIANRMADASRLAPLVYVQLVAATLLGYAVFGDIPDMASMAGIFLLLSSGLVSFLLLQNRTVPGKA